MLRNIHVIRHGDIERISQLGVTNIAQLVVPENEADYPSVDMFGWLPSFGVYCRHARAITLENITILPTNPDFRPALVFDDVGNLAVSNVIGNYTGIATRTGASMFLITNSPTISLTAAPNPTDPPGGWILATP